MILATIDSIPGKELEVLGIVKGSAVQTAHVGKDIGAVFKTLVGGELTGYNDMMNKSRAMATERMVKNAEALGADAVIGVRYTSASIMQSAAEVMAYGTAVKYR